MSQFFENGSKINPFMPALLLQKPIKSSKPKEYLEALTRWLSPLTEMRIDKLAYEGQTIQGCLKFSDKAANITKTAEKFHILIKKEM